MDDWADRFWEKVDVRGKDECWEWTGAKGSCGYGQLKVSGRMQTASRLAWELEHGPIPEGICVCHICDNPACVNPAHLFLGTHRDNVYDMIEKGRGNVLLHPVGIHHPNSKLSEDDVREIRRLYATGKFLQKQLGKRFGVARTQIGNIVRRECWAHLK